MSLAAATRRRSKAATGWTYSPGADPAGLPEGAPLTVHELAHLLALGGYAKRLLTFKSPSKAPRAVEGTNRAPGAFLLLAPFFTWVFEFVFTRGAHPTMSF